MADVKDKKEKQPVSSGLAVASLTVGVFGFLLAWTGVFGLPVSVIAIVFGVVALFNKQNHDLAVAGLVLGIVSLLVSFGVLVVALTSLNDTPPATAPMYNVHTYQFRNQ
ncbi:MAG: DUF4190 domain-containing protein [Candidatus Nomurabacteria bacterium]|nr:MAG: DUF4190 domain-containing protein [Candidatus Nomurabacteria bacterium]